MRTKVNDFREVIRLFGSADKMAAELGIRINTTRHWLTRNSIPARYWHRVLPAANAKGAKVTAEDFVRFAAS